MAQIHSFPVSGDFCHLLINLANSLDTDQTWRVVGPNLFDTLIVFLKEFFEKVNFEKKSDDKKACKKINLCRTI